MYVCTEKVSIFIHKEYNLEHRFIVQYNIIAHSLQKNKHFLIIKQWDYYNSKLNLRK